jgi:hypothetical protein
VSDSPALHSRWPLLLKIEISSNGQNCSILSRNVPKFELYKHNGELFNMLHDFLWTVVSEEKFFFNFIPPFFYFELGGHLGWKSGSPDTILEEPSKNHFSKVWLRLAQLLLWNYWANLNQTLLKLS